MAEEDFAVIKNKTPLPLEPLGSITPPSKIDKTYLEKWRELEDAKRAYNLHIESCTICGRNKVK